MKPASNILSFLNVLFLPLSYIRLFRSIYAFLFPNFMLNRYGPWLDTNAVVPTGKTKTDIVITFNDDERSLKPWQKVW